MNYTILRAELRHLRDLVPLFEGYRKFYRAEAAPDRAADFLRLRIERDESVIYIAYDENCAVGFTQLYPIFSSVSMQRIWVLNDLYVSPEQRGNSIGRSLLLRAQEYAADDSAKSLILETGIHNPAQKLYEHLGWKKDEEYLHYVWTP